MTDPNNTPTLERYKTVSTVCEITIAAMVLGLLILLYLWLNSGISSPALAGVFLGFLIVGIKHLRIANQGIEDLTDEDATH